MDANKEVSPVERAKATAPQLCDALGACRDLHPVYRHLLEDGT